MATPAASPRPHRRLPHRLRPDRPVPFARPVAVRSLPVSPAGSAGTFGPESGPVTVRPRDPPAAAAPPRTGTPTDPWPPLAPYPAPRPDSSSGDRPVLLQPSSLRTLLGTSRSRSPPWSTCDSRFSRRFYSSSPGWAPTHCPAWAPGNPGPGWEEDEEGTGTDANKWGPCRSRATVPGHHRSCPSADILQQG